MLGKRGTLAGTLGTLNPFRYRGYVYDEETGLYYLRSRYYNPEWGRFISADALLGKTGALFSHNLFAYCGNNPIIGEDQEGTLWNIIGAIAGAVIGAVAGAAASYLISGEVNWCAVVGGAVAGALVGAGLGFIADEAASATIQATTAATITKAGEKVYYHVTSNQAANGIIKEGIIKGGEFGKVYVLDYQPTLQEARQIGARFTETVIRFTAKNTRFVLDKTVFLTRGAYYTETNGIGVLVKSVEKVGFR